MERLKPGTTVTVTTTASATPGKGTIVEVTNTAYGIRFDAMWNVVQLVPFTEITSLRVDQLAR